MTDHDYSQFTTKPKGDSLLAKISDVATQIKKQQLLVAEKEEELQSAKAELKNLEEFVMPELMDEADQEQLRTASGINVNIKEIIRASIPEAKKPIAFKWLTEHGHDTMIKSQFVVEFDRADKHFADEFAHHLDEEWGDVNLHVKKKETIHPQTLGSFIREQLAEGVSIPLEPFGVYRQRIAKVD